MPRNCSIRTHHALALAFLLGSVATPALAVSVNDMVVWSAANQPLRMDIELVDLRGADVRDLRVSVASENEHGRVGLTRPEWADSVRFAIIALPSGKIIARATSSAAVSADFVSFMVSIRGAGISQLQQVASKVTAGGAEPLAAPDAQAVQPRRELEPDAKPATATPFADKPMVKAAPVAAPKPVAAPAPVAKPAPTPVAKPAPVTPTPSPVAEAPSPAPAELVAAAEADNDMVLADVGSEPTLESLQAEREQVQQQITDLQARVTALDQQINALNPEIMPETETATALAESETSPVASDEEAKAKLPGFSYFSNVLLILLGLFISGMVVLDRLRARMS